MSKPRYISSKILILPKFLVYLFVINSIAQNHTVPGKIETKFPSIINIGIDWFIEGDDNQNGVVNIFYREKTMDPWQRGMDLRRIPAASGKGKLKSFSWKNKHSGSIFDLKPDTEYQLKLILIDADGGNQTSFTKARTRPSPKIDYQTEIVDLLPGTYDTLFVKSGSKQKPIAYTCSKGTATFKFVDLRNKKWVTIHGLAVVNQFDHGIGIMMNGAENCVISYCKINAVYGIVAYLPGATNCVIKDNTITGTSFWSNEAMGAHGGNEGEGIEMTGPGNVICYNKVSSFRDCISTMEDSHVYNQTGIDIYNNDIYNGLDDGIEADFCFSNCRILRNRMTNCYVGLSSQPSLGGPTYFIRNVMYNIVHSAFKLKRFSQGDVVLHNTVIKVGVGLGGNSSMDYAYFRNNLAFGGATGGVSWGGYGAGKPYAADITDPGTHSSFDYDAIGVYGTPYIAKIGGIDFLKIEKHGIPELIFEDVFNTVSFTNPPIPELETPDLRPKQGSKVEDAALYIPNINDGFKGSAPDCGAYEIGEELPHYGPRPIESPNLYKPNFN